MPLPRMTTRRWMIAVAVAAFAIAACLESTKLVAVSAERWRLARYYTGSAASHREFAALGERSARNLRQTAEQHRAAGRSDWSILESAALTVQRQSEHQRGVAADSAHKSARYSRAARRPWLPVPPDPAEPE